MEKIKLHDLLEKECYRLHKVGDYARYHFFDVPADVDCDIDCDFIKDADKDYKVLYDKLGLDAIISTNGFTFLVRKYLPEERRIQATLK